MTAVERNLSEHVSRCIGSSSSSNWLTAPADLKELQKSEDQMLLAIRPYYDATMRGKSIACKFKQLASQVIVNVSESPEFKAMIKPLSLSLPIGTTTGSGRVNMGGPLSMGGHGGPWCSYRGQTISLDQQSTITVTRGIEGDLKLASINLCPDGLKTLPHCVNNSRMTCVISRLTGINSLLLFWYGGFSTIVRVIPKSAFDTIAKQLVPSGDEKGVTTANVEALVSTIPNSEALVQNTGCIKIIDLTKLSEAKEDDRELIVVLKSGDHFVLGVGCAPKGGYTPSDPRTGSDATSATGSDASWIRVSGGSDASSIPFSTGLSIAMSDIAFK